jgi:hypothetical protein
VYLACIDIYKDVVIFCAAAVGRWAVDWLCTAAATFVAVAWWTQGQSRSLLLEFVITKWRCAAFAAWMALFGVKVKLQDDEGEVHARGVGAGGCLQQMTAMQAAHLRLNSIAGTAPTRPFQTNVCILLLTY